MVAVAGLLRGKFDLGMVDPVLLAFLSVLLTSILGLGWWLRRVRISAIALGIFVMTYGLFAAFIAAMAFRDTWL